MPGHMIIPLDGSNLSEMVLPYARQFAKVLKMDVELLRVAQTPEDNGSAGAEDVAEQYLKTVVPYFRGTGVTVTTKVGRGEPSSAITEEADASPDNVVAMSTHGRSGLTRWVLGSVADKVLRYSDKPLLLVRPTPRSPIAKEKGLEAVIVPLDGSKLAEEVLPHVKQMAQAMYLRVILVRVTPTFGEYYKWSDAGLAYQPDFTETAATVDSDAKKYLARIAAKLKKDGLTSVVTHQINGDPAAVISDMASSAENVFVAMTTRGRTGLTRTVLGSVADRIVRNCGAPVFLARPS